VSTSLHWRPTSEGSSLGYALKWSLSEKLWGHDGSLSGDWVEVGLGLVPFLEGIVAAHSSAREGTQQAEIRAEAQRLIDLIAEHGTVELSLS
jgi:hypothetical protein